MAANKWMTRLSKLEGAVNEYDNPHLKVIRSPSPSLNFVFGNGWGLPQGLVLAMYGPPKAGKTLISNAMIGQLHRDDPDAIAIKFDSEYRERLQNGPAARAIWGIDEDRFKAYEVSEPNLIFDPIEKEVSAMIDDGAPIKLIIIDSLSQIQGRRAMNADSVMQQQIGDNAATIQEGLKRILPIIKRKNIALILTTQVRAEMDPIQQMRGKKYKMQAAFAVKHCSEYFMLIERNEAKDGKLTLDGREFIDDTIRDVRDHGEATGHKIRVKMEDSSGGPKGRVGEFTIDYRKGIVNTYEEVFLLGVNRNIIEQPNQVSYIYKGNKWHGKKEMLKALEQDSELYNNVIDDLRKQDMDASGAFAVVPPRSEESSED